MAQSSVPAAAAANLQPHTAPATRSSRRWIAAGVVLVVAIAAGSYWRYANHFEETDDAQIDGSISSVSPRVSGNVSSVFVVENQVVHAGDVLAEIDPTDWQIALDQARAQVAQARAQLEAEDPSVPITQTSNATALASAQSELTAGQAAVSAAREEVEQLTAQLAQAVANDRTAQLDKERSERLVAQGAVSQADYDQKQNAATASSANLRAIEQSLAAARDRVRQQQAQILAVQSRVVETQSNAPRQVATRRASVLFRQAALDLANAQAAQAEKNLSYAKIIAPISGIVAKKAISLGDHVAPGQQIIAISPIEALWITANFRETQIARMQPGQPARVHVDAIDLDLRGSIDSLGGATGSRLSVLPPENASGNYVKVVQRIPVRIRLDPDQTGLDRLRIGMSAEPRVTVQ